jgi:uncharacterized protein
VAAVRSLSQSEAVEPKPLMLKAKRMLMGGFAGGVAGFMGGLLGIGGGFMIAPLLMEMGYPTKEAAATTAFIVTFSSFSGFLGHLSVSHIDLTLVTVTVLAVLAGSQGGAWFMMNKAKPSYVKKLYGIILLLVAFQLLLSLFNNTDQV